MFEDEIQRLLNLPLGERINAGSRFIEDEDGGTLDEDSHQRHKLSLPHREAVAALADFRAQTIGQSLQPFAIADTLCHFKHLVFSHAWHGVPNIVRDPSRK